MEKNKNFKYLISIAIVFVASGAPIFRGPRGAEILKECIAQGNFYCTYIGSGRIPVILISIIIIIWAINSIIDYKKHKNTSR